jgi:hypothetical protein
MRLIAFGCSHTYGEGQVDCLNYYDDHEEYPADTPSQYAWPALLGKKLDKKVVNLGSPGCSNRYISEAILNTTIEKDDIIVILWTEVNRSIVFRNSNITQSTNIHPNYTTKLSKNYYKWIHNPYNSFLESLEAINLANYHLQNHRHVYNFKANFISKSSDTNDILYEYPEWNKVTLINQSLHWVDLAADKDHPGPESQKLIARDMLKHLDGTILQ